MHLVGLIIRIYHHACSRERQIHPTFLEYPNFQEKIPISIPPTVTSVTIDKQYYFISTVQGYK